MKIYNEIDMVLMYGNHSYYNFGSRNEFLEYLPYILSTDNRLKLLSVSISALTAVCTIKIAVNDKVTITQGERHTMFCPQQSPYSSEIQLSYLDDRMIHVIYDIYDYYKENYD